MANDVVDRSGWDFFMSGKRIATTIRNLARDMQSRNAAGIEWFIAPEFAGKPLGLSNLEEREAKDGVHRLVMRGGTAAGDRAAAVKEWADYLNSFESIEEVALHVHRLESWDDPARTVASVRFELLGTPKGAPGPSVDRAYFRMGFRAEGQTVKITSAELMEGDRYSGEKPQFQDVARGAGVDFVNKYYPPFLNEPMKFGMIRYGPGGITAIDIDNDGWADLFIPDGEESKLFRNLGDGRFEDITTRAGLAGLDGVSVGVFADYDNDGFKDFFVSRTFKPNLLFRNNGDGTFSDVTKKAGIGEDCCTTVASWADYNNDGKLDLYVGRYLDPRLAIPTTFYARNGEPNQLYRNNGDGTFTNVTKEAGVGEVGLCLGTVWGDINDDGYPDLYVVNDFGRNTLYRNNKNGTFTDISVESGTLAYGAGMSATYGDYDNDLKGDLYCANIRSDDAWFAEPPTVRRYMLNTMRQNVWMTDMPLYFEIFQQVGFRFTDVFQQMASGNTLMRNRGDGTFEDTTWRAAANPPGWFWGTVLTDFDNDGWKDLYAANGWVYNDRGTEIELEFLNGVVSRMKDYKSGMFFDPKQFGRESWHGWERNRYMRNRGDGTFEEIGRPAGNDLILNSRGVATADFWNRGVMDLAVAASTDRHALLRNELAGRRNWLQVELVGTKSNRDAVGARVIISVGGKKQMQEVVLGDSYGSQSTLRQHFGIGGAAAVDELQVIWPRSGEKQRFLNLAANRVIRITEGSNELVEPNYRRPGAK